MFLCVTICGEKNNWVKDKVDVSCGILLCLSCGFPMAKKRFEVPFLFHGMIYLSFMFIILTI